MLDGYSLEVPQGTANEYPTAYHIQPNYHTYPYKHTVKEFWSLQITASVFVHFVLRVYVVGTHLNLIDLSMQFK